MQGLQGSAIIGFLMQLHEIGHQHLAQAMSACKPSKESLSWLADRAVWEAGHRYLERKEKPMLVGVGQGRLWIDQRPPGATIPSTGHECMRGPEGCKGQSTQGCLASWFRDVGLLTPQQDDRNAC